MLIPLGILDSAGAPGTFELIQTQLVSSGSPTSITFNSIPATYKHLQVRLTVRGAVASTATAFSYQFNGDTASNYSSHFLQGDGSSVGSGSYLSSTILVQDMPAATGTAGSFMTAIIDILDYANTSKYKTSRSLSGRLANQTMVRMNSGNWRNTAAITSINFYDFSASSAFAVGTRISLYGIKG